MSLQIQSSQQPPSSGGRRTPQVYQNLATAGGGATGAAPTPGVNPAAPTNGNSGKASKLSLKASAKQNPSVVAAPAPQQPQPDVIIIDPVPPKEILKGASAAAASSNVVVSVAKLPAGTNGNSTNGKHDEAAKPAAPTTPKKDEEVKEKKVKSSPRATPQKQQQQQESIPVEHIKTPESAGKKGAAASKDTTPTVVTPENKKKSASAADNSLAAEKTLKGFTAEGDEMESLVVEPTEYEDSPMPPRTGGKSKLLKYAGAPPTRARISPFRVNSANAAAAAAATATANLSTVSEGQATESNEASPAVPPADFNRPLRAISGRRSTRPLTDIQFTYRKSTDLNDSSSSLNVTVGSEIHNDSLRTPGGLAGSSRKRKNMTPESTSDALDVQEHTDSPKRTRLDFSGFLGIVASPVTMLKNRFSRVRLATSSTPVAKRNYDEEDLATCVTAEATTTTANISGGQAAGSSEAKMDVEPAETPVETDAKKDGEESTTTTPKDGQTDLPAEGDASVAEEAQEESVEVKDITDKQRRCVIM